MARSKNVELEEKSGNQKHYRIAEGQALCGGPRGHLSAGEEVSIRDCNDQTHFDELVSSGLIVES